MVTDESERRKGEKKNFSFRFIFIISFCSSDVSFSDFKSLFFKKKKKIRENKKNWVSTFLFGF